MTLPRTFSGFRPVLKKIRASKYFPALLVLVCSPIIYIGIKELVMANEEHQEDSNKRYARMQVMEVEEPVGRNVNEPDNAL